MHGRLAAGSFSIAFLVILPHFCNRPLAQELLKQPFLGEVDVPQGARDPLLGSGVVGLRPAAAPIFPAPSKQFTPMASGSSVDHLRSISSHVKLL